MISTSTSNKMKVCLENEGLFEKYAYDEVLVILKRCKKDQDPRNKGIWLDVKQPKKVKPSWLFHFRHIVYSYGNFSESF